MLFLTTCLFSLQARRLLRDKRDRRDPADTQCRGGSAVARGKRSAWNGNQQPSLTEQIF